MSKQIVSKAVGIDLGTTNSAVAIMDLTDTKIIIHTDANTGGAQTTPSCVWKNPKNGQSVVGRTAFRRIGTTPAPIRSIKRSMGKATTVRLTDEDASPEQISASILGEMKRQIEEDVAGLATDSTEWIVDRAIVTVPAYFDQSQIDSTRKAAEMAGLQLLDLLHEPTAAASYHCWKNKVQDGVFLVYDLGGGTFDVSILRSVGGSFEVLGISGDKRLGGDDIDIALAEDLRQRLLQDKEANYELDLDMNNEEDKLRFNQLKFLAEDVKKKLSNASEFHLLDQNSIRDKADEHVLIEMMYRRHEIEALMRPIIERTIPYCFDALEIASKRTGGGEVGVTLADVDAVILAGGSTHIPLVREMVKKALCADATASEPRAKCEEPVYEKVDTIVALGAAIRAAASGGLAVYNPERTVRVSFRGAAATGAKRTNVSGEVEALTPDIDLSGGKVRLTITEQGYRDEEELKEGKAFHFKAVPLQPNAENLLTFEIFDHNGALVATAERPISQGQGIPSGTGSVLVKAISLEVERNGKTIREELFKAMTLLPATEDFTFTHPGETELVRLSFYQQATVIQEIKIPVPSSLPRGTEINLNVHIDKLSFVTIRGQIGNISFEVALNLPAPRPLPMPEELKALDDRFREAMTYQPAGKRNIFEARYKKAIEVYEATVKPDPEQAVHQFELMENLAREAEEGVGGPLKPPKNFFDKLVNDCYDLNQYAEVVTAKSGAAQPHNATEIAKAIDVQRERGEQAFRDSEQRAYSETIVMLENIRRHLASVLQPYVQGGNTQPEPQRVIKDVRELAERLAQLAAAKDRKDFQNEIEQMKSSLDKLEREIHHDAQGVQSEVLKIGQRLEQISNILMGQSTPDNGGKIPEHTRGSIYA